MNWSTVFALTSGSVILLVGLLRIERKWLWAALLFTLLITALIWDWLRVRGAWAETALSAGLAILLVGSWWLWIGRKLPPTVPTIKVWGQDAAPKPKAAELQAEVNRLREANELLEAQLRQLRGTPPEHTDPPPGSTNPS